MAALLPVREGKRRHVSLWGCCHKVPLGPLQFCWDCHLMLLSSAVRGLVRKPHRVVSPAVKLLSKAGTKVNRGKWQRGAAGSDFRKFCLN